MTARHQLLHYFFDQNPRPVHTLTMYRQWDASGQAYNRHSIRHALRELLGTGRITRIRNGLYVLSEWKANEWLRHLIHKRQGMTTRQILVHCDKVKLERTDAKAMLKMMLEGGHIVAGPTLTGSEPRFFDPSGLKPYNPTRDRLDNTP